MSDKALKTTDFFLSFFVWIESNKDPFLFDVIKLLRPDLGVRVNFFPSIAGSYHKTSDVRHSFKLHGTSFFLHALKMVGGREKQMDAPSSLVPNTFTTTLPWSNSAPYINTRVPQAPFCAAIKIAHLEPEDIHGGGGGCLDDPCFL